MNMLRKILARVIAKFHYSVKLVLTTPHYGWIIVLQLVSGTLSFIGIPMIIPILEFMQAGGPSPNTLKSLSFLSNLITPFGLEANFHTLLFIASVLIVFSQLLIILSGLIASWVNINLNKKYKKQILNAYKDVDWLWLTNYHSGEMNYAIINEVNLACVAHLNSQRVVISLIQTLVYFALAIKLSLMSALLAMVIYALLGIINLLNSRRVAQLCDINNKGLSQLSKTIIGLQQNKKFLKTSLLNNAFIDKIFASLDNLYNRNRIVHLRTQFQQGWNFLFTFIFLITLILFHKLLAIDYFQLLLIVVVLNRLGPQFTALSAAFLAMNSHIPMHVSLMQRLDDLAANKELNGSDMFNGHEPIVFKEVNFAYPQGKQVINNLNLTIQPHKTTAFVGGSGAGKSTILDLTLGLLKPNSGAIYYGDIPHRTLDINSLRKKVAYVSQETTLFDGTLRENLTISCPQATEAMIHDICHRVRIDKFIAELPEGLNTQIGENGIKLSGGQRQRLVLGRSLFSQPSILILDEATSELDLESEAMIQETINDLSKELTIIIVAHRLSTVKGANLIYVIENGQICESGTYQKLLAKKGRLYYLDSLQKLDDRKKGKNDE